MNLPEEKLEVYTNPSGEGYRDHKVYTIADQVPLSLEGQAAILLPVKDMLA